MMKLAVGQVAIVTGAGSGLGRAMALDLAAQGAAVAVAGNKPDPLAETLAVIEQQGGRGLVVHCDVSVEDQVAAMVRSTVEGLGRLDILVSNAGVEFAKSVLDTTVDEWDWLMGVNVRGPFLGAKHAIPAMLASGGGTIVNIASELALIGSEKVAAYSTSKGALLQMTRALAVDHAPDIRINCLCPGVIMTDILRTAIDATPDPAARLAEFENRTLLKRLGTPEEAAAATTFLATAQSSYMTGATLVLDGGWTAH